MRWRPLFLTLPGACPRLYCFLRGAGGFRGCAKWARRSGCRTRRRASVSQNCRISGSCAARILRAIRGFWRESRRLLFILPRQALPRLLLSACFCILPWTCSCTRGGSGRAGAVLSRFDVPRCGLRALERPRFFGGKLRVANPGLRADLGARVVNGHGLKTQRIVTERNTLRDLSANRVRSLTLLSVLVVSF